MFFFNYSRCGHCRNVFDGSLTAYMNDPTPCCNKTGKVHQMWPSGGVRAFLEMALKRPLTTKGSKVDDVYVSIMMLSAAGEAMLEELLLSLAVKAGLNEIVFDALMDAYEGRERRLNLFKALNDKSVGNLVQIDPALATFMADWKALANLRNQIAHGSEMLFSKSDLEPVERFRDNLLEVYKLLNNNLAPKKPPDF
jgi:hypothetical protein